jgi:hypothetical protein
MTVSAWVNPSFMSGWETVLMKERGTAGAGLLSYALYAHDGAPLSSGHPVPGGYVRLGPNPNTTVDQAARGLASLPLNTWSHIAVTYDGHIERFFLNGVQVAAVTLVPAASPAVAIGAGTGGIRIGGNASSTNEFFNGMIDEVRVYSRALTAAEIVTDMNTAIVR